MGTPLGSRFPYDDVRETSAAITLTFTASPTGNTIFSGSMSATLSFTVSPAGSGVTILKREITDTVTHLQKPVNVVLAEQALRDPRGRLTRPGAMTPSMFKKIMKE